MTTILATIFVFGIIVFIHEFGHFITAKASGMQVDEFAIGFGPALVKVRKGETLYSIRLIPLGGYNKIAGMTDEEELNERSFLNKSVWKRFIVIAAGAVFNFLLAIVLFFLVFLCVGQRQASNEPLVGSIASGSPAAIAHMQVNDRIISIGDKPIAAWTDIAKALEGKSKKVVTVVVKRGDMQESLSLIPVEQDGRVLIGIMQKPVYKSFSFGEAVTHSVTFTGHTIYDMLHGLWAMVTGQEKAELSGPIGVSKMAGEVAAISFASLVYFTGILSLNLGVINLLPLPVLDGGHLILLIIEGITGKKLPSKALQYIQMTGVALLLLLFLYTTISDISRL